MATAEKYALMAARAYSGAGPLNQVPDPVGWTRIEVGAGVAGLEYSVFSNGADEIVIAYAGTSTDWADVLEWIPDWATNAVAALGMPVISQLVSAAQAYVATRLAHPTANISFTGHSLGGGLASVMAVWFDRPATVFDPAPFQNSVLGPGSPILSAVAKGNLAWHGGVEAASWLSYSEFDFGAREGNVESYSVIGTWLQAILGGMPRIEGFSSPLDIGPEPASMWSRHSMGFHAAAVSSDLLRLALRELPIAGAALFDEALYSRDWRSDDPDFIRMLLRRESEGALHNFALDLRSVTGTGGVQLLSGGLVAALMDRYMNAPAGTVPQMTDVISGGIHLASPVSTAPGRARLSATLAALLQGEDRRAAVGRLSTITDWYVNNNGATALVVAPHATDDAAIGSAVTDTLEGGAGNDLLCGGAGNDHLYGGDDNDVLLGSVGIDVLDGGGGNDHLSGGSEDDTLSGGSGVDTLDGGTGTDLTFRTSRA